MANKDLSNMSLEELWKLFPIVLVSHKDEWFDYFDEEKKILENLFSSFELIRISHIGSTAIKDIAAKPVVDILVEFKNLDASSIKDI